MRAIGVLAALSLPLVVLAQEIRLGNEFQINAHTRTPSRPLGRHWRPTAASSWRGTTTTRDGSGSAVVARRFSSTGAALTGEFQVNSHTVETQRRPSVAVSAGGGFVVAWNSNFQDGSMYSVFARRFSSAGVALAAEFQVNSYTQFYQYQPVAADTIGDFVVVWISDLQDGDLSGVFGRRFSSAGSPLASEFQVNGFTPGVQYRPTLAADGDGDFVVAWISDAQDGNMGGVFARRFSSAGAPSPPSSRSTPTPWATSTSHGWRRARTVTSSSPGKATARTVRWRVSSPDGSRAPAQL